MAIMVQMAAYYYGCNIVHKYNHSNMLIVMSSEYDKVLNDIKNKVYGEAKNNILRLYGLLLNEGLEPLDAADKVRHDLIDTYSRTTIHEHLPKEGKRKYTKQLSDTEHIEDKIIQVENTGTQEPTKPDTVPTGPIPVPTTPITPSITALDLTNPMLYSKLMTIRNNGYSTAYIHSIDNKVVDIKSKR